MHCVLISRITSNSIFVWLLRVLFNCKLVKLWIHYWPWILNIFWATWLRTIYKTLATFTDPIIHYHVTFTLKSLFVKHAVFRPQIVVWTVYSVHCCYCCCYRCWCYDAARFTFQGQVCKLAHLNILELHLKCALPHWRRTCWWSSPRWRSVRGVFTM